MTNLDNSPRARGEPLAARITARLKQAILDAEFQFGEALSEDKLAAAFGTSRTPVRSALTALQVQGLIEIKPQSGSFVFVPTRQNLEDLCEFRTLLELQALTLSINRRRDETIALLRNASNRMEEEKLEGDWQAVAQTDSSYHRAIVQNCGNIYLLESFELVAARVDAIRTRITMALGEIRARAMNEHVAIIDALEEGKLSKAKSILRSHIMTALSSFDMACKEGTFNAKNADKSFPFDGLQLNSD
ncbi:GntR family transcriptional regulator [Propionivibrio sp.]|uniref:GntR family transcriptional regulator n=1 Tax=Propionivibrio sp. TaxID=2212460 RepID=UPI0039E588D5